MFLKWRGIQFVFRRGVLLLWRKGCTVFALERVLLKMKWS